MTLAGVADGAEGLVLADLARAIASGERPPAVSLTVVCRDGGRMAMLARGLGFFAPDIEVLQFPAWDCLPYDRVSPHAAVVAQRMMTLARLAHVTGRERPAVLLTTVNAILQRVPVRGLIARQSLSAAPGNMLPLASVTQWLELNGFNRASTVREPGDYALRGGIVDLFAPGMDEPVRLDFFGDTLESIRSFDPETQRSISDLRALDLVPMAEFQLTSDTIRRFRTGYVAAFGAAAPDDLLYEAVSEGRRHAGMEHWLPLFHQRLDTLFDYIEASPIAIEPLAEEAAHERFAQIADYYQARKDAIDQNGGGAPYKPLPPDLLYLGERNGASASARRRWRGCRPLRRRKAAPTSSRSTPMPATISPPNAPRRAPMCSRRDQHVNALQGPTRDRRALERWFARAHGPRARRARTANLAPVASWPRRWLCRATPSRSPCSVSNPVSRPRTSRSSPRQDILGERLVRARRQSKRAENFIAEVTSLSAGDLVVHVDHGIGRFVGLRAIEAAARRTIVSNSIMPAATSCSCRSRTSNCCRATVRRRPAPSSTGSAAPPGSRAKRG